MLTLLRDPAQRAILAETGQAVAREQYGLERAVAQFMKLYES
jgi:hypothetical protein